MKTWLNFTSNFLDQNNPISKYQCKNKLIYITTVLSQAEVITMVTRAFMSDMLGAVASQHLVPQKLEEI